MEPSRCSSKIGSRGDGSPRFSPSIMLSPINHWAEFNQTCYMNSPHGKGVWEQHYLSVWLSHYQQHKHRAWEFCDGMPFTAQSSLLLSLCFSDGDIVNASIHLSVTKGQVKQSLSVCPSITLSPLLLTYSVDISSQTTGWNLTKLATRLPCMVRVCKSRVFFTLAHVTFSSGQKVTVCLSIHPSITLSPKQLGRIEPNFLHNFPLF